MKKLSKHPKFRTLLQTIKKFKNLTWSGCADGKAQKAPYSRSQHHLNPGEVLSIVGPHDPSFNNNSILLTIVDTASRYFISIPTISRSNTKVHIKQTLNQCLHLHGRHPKILIADNKKEFIGNDITAECESLGVKLQSIVPHHPQENSINERIHRIIYEAARSALSHTHSYHPNTETQQY